MRRHSANDEICVFTVFLYCIYFWSHEPPTLHIHNKNPIKNV